MGPDDPFDVKKPARELGLDSLMAVELRNQIARAMDMRLPVSPMFDHPTVAAVAERLSALVAERAAA